MILNSKGRKQLQNSQEKQRAKLKRNLARYAHDSWSGWMGFLFSKSTMNPDGTCTIPAELVERWKRQANTAFAELPAGEEVSDYTEADKMIAVMEGVKA